MAVIDVAAVGQLFATVAQLMELVGLNVKDLAALSNLGPILALIQHITVLQQQLDAMAQMLKTLAAGWGVLIDDAILPCTAGDLRAWNYQAATWSRRGVREALQAQQLIAQTAAMLQTLTQILGLVSSIGGTTAGLQTTAALMGQSAAQLQAIQMQMGGVNSVLIGAQAIEQTNVLANDCIARARLADWGTMP